MARLSEEEKSDLHRQLVKLGDMLGDGLDLEPGGKWIRRDYRKIAIALGYINPSKRTSNRPAINALMEERVQECPCKECGGELKQTRSGSMRAKCQSCERIYQLIKRG